LAFNNNITIPNPEGNLAKKIFCPQRKGRPFPQIEPQKYPSSKDAANKSDKYSQYVTQDVRKILFKNPVFPMLDSESI
jgi:hypothetical protein